MKPAPLVRYQQILHNSEYSTEERPSPTRPVVDFVARTEHPITMEEVKDQFRGAAAEGPLEGILGVSEEELVSSDVIGTTYSALVDLPSTMLLGDRTVKIVAWYDNEWAYARRVVDLALHVAPNEGDT